MPAEQSRELRVRDTGMMAKIPNFAADEFHQAI
jgi:hypothetical protein